MKNTILIPKEKILELSNNFDLGSYVRFLAAQNSKDYIEISKEKILELSNNIDLGDYIRRKFYESN